MSCVIEPAKYFHAFSKAKEKNKKFRFVSVCLLTHLYRCCEDPVAKEQLKATCDALSIRKQLQQQFEAVKKQ